MIPDPARQLADFGRRVLKTARPPVALPGYYGLPDAYESLLLDPMVALSEVCDGLLERQPAAPVATGHGGSAGILERRPLPERVLQRESPAATQPDIPGRGVPANFERVRRAMEAPLDPFLHEPAATQAAGSVSRAHGPTPPSGRPRRPAGSDTPGPRDRLDRYAGVRQAAKHEPYPVDRSPASEYPTGPEGLGGEPSPEDRGGTQRPVRRECPEEGRPFPGGGRPAMDGERLAAADATSWTMRDGSTPAAPDAGGSLPAGETRLATSASRLAAMLRADAATSGVEEDLPEVAQDGVAFPVRSRDGRIGDPPLDGEDRAGPYGRVDVEEVMERLADELEAGFVRTYGSSGG